jgi:hypothetical protein
MCQRTGHGFTSDGAAGTSTDLEADGDFGLGYQGSVPRLIRLKAITHAFLRAG